MHTGGGEIRVGELQVSPLLLYARVSPPPLCSYRRRGDTGSTRYPCDRPRPSLSLARSMPPKFCGVIERARRERARAREPWCRPPRRNKDTTCIDDPQRFLHHTNLAESSLPLSWSETKRVYRLSLCVSVCVCVCLGCLLRTLCVCVCVCVCVILIQTSYQMVV